MTRPSVLIGVSSAAILLVSACDGGGSFAASAEIVNECDSSIGVTVGNSYAQRLELPRPSGVHEVAPGKVFMLNNAVLKPVPETVYVYVAGVDDPEFHDPSAVPLDTLPFRASNGTDIYTIVVSGDMCPVT